MCGEGGLEYEQQTGKDEDKNMNIKKKKRGKWETECQE